MQNKDKYYLYITDVNTNVDMKALPKKIGIEKIRFAEKNKLQQILNVPVDCVTLFGIMNNKNNNLEIIIDDTVLLDKNVNFHPLRNDATTTISYQDMMKFIDHLKYKMFYIKH